MYSIHFWSPRLLSVLLPMLMAAGCRQEPEDRDLPPLPGEPTATTGDTGAVPGAAVGTTYRRTVIFMETSPDSSMFVPWDFVNRVEADGIRRSTRGWLGRAGEWRMFVQEDWTTELTRAPWRIVPRGSARLVVGLDDAITEIYFREGLRDLSVRPGEVVAEWNGQRGETFRLRAGTAVLAGVETQGLVLDAFTARTTAGDEFTELALLTGDDGFQLVVADVEGTGLYRAWARTDTESYSWSEVEVVWQETRTFERARRDVPVLWRIDAAEPDLSGEFEAVSSHLHTPPGTGALLPVFGVYEVRGHVDLETGRIDVAGFLRHFQR
ncbi:MAG: hypothetical protein F4Y07_13300 [Gemmatimonadetes bacterium]|nr:hypothetical protein [Gemmatimonadota bacterium]MYE17446.1 hypothetical protein [Gemmatimonadota bacterium]